MAIDLVKGLKRIFYVISVVWIGFFLYKADFYNLIKDEATSIYFTSYFIFSDSKCESVLGNPREKYVEYGKKKTWRAGGWLFANTPRTRQILTNGKISGFIGGHCSFHKIDRIIDLKYDYLFTSIAPIPFYFILLFIVRGFRKKDK